MIELSLTVPVVNSLAFLFTVLGDWLAVGKTVHKGLRSFCAYFGLWDGGLIAGARQILGLGWR